MGVDMCQWPVPTKSSSQTYYIFRRHLSHSQTNMLLLGERVEVEQLHICGIAVEDKVVADGMHVVAFGALVSERVVQLEQPSNPLQTF